VASRWTSWAEKTAISSAASCLSSSVRPCRKAAAPGRGRPAPEHPVLQKLLLNLAVRGLGLMVVGDGPGSVYLLANGYDIRTVQELLGHRSVKTTMIYTHVLNRGGRGVQSPLETDKRHGPIQHLGSLEVGIGDSLEVPDFTCPSGASPSSHIGL